MENNNLVHHVMHDVVDFLNNYLKERNLINIKLIIEFKYKPDFIHC